MLNEEQKQAIEILSGPVRVLAGAGTGKTFTLIKRIDHLIESGAPPYEILVLTFTNKAVHELKNRAKNKGVQIMTFHSLAARLLRHFWKENFTINDDEDPETLSFDDLLNKLLELFDDYKILEQCQSLFTQIMIDEYQDVNEAQIEIMQKLSFPHKNICVVGDPDQTIYSWRGANVNTMAQFEEIYSDAKTIILTKNYRNPVKILESAETLIKHDPDRIKKTLVPIKQQEQGVNLWSVKDIWENTESLFHILESILGSHSNMTDADHLDAGQDNHEHSFGDIAIMYRTQEQGRLLQKKLEDRGYPYQRSAPECFWESPEIAKFCEQLEQLKNLEEFPDQIFSKWIAERINDFIEAEDLSETKQTNLKSLISIAISFDGTIIENALQQFLDERQSNIDADNLVNENAIQLLTLHAAKGLEFPIVIITNLEEESIPHKNSIEDPYFLAEERRLLYVGMTRATAQLHLMTTKTFGPPSRFIREIGHYETATLPEAKSERLRKRKIKNVQASLF